MNGFPGPNPARRALLSCATLFFAACGSEEPLAEAPAAVLVTPYTLVEADAYTGTQRFSGQVEAGRSSQVGFELGGELARVQVDEGDLVKAGDRLASLDDSRLRAARAAARAAVDQAEAQATLSAATYERVAEARAFDGVSQQELDEALERKARTAAAREAARADLERIEVDLAKTSLISPYDAVVVRRMADEGQVLGAGQTVLELQELAALEVRLAVTGKALDGLGVGRPVELSVDGETVDATVVAVIPRRDRRTRAVDVRLQIADGAAARVGDIAELRLETTVQRAGYWVPMGALTEGARGVWYVLAIAGEDERLPSEVRRATGATHALEQRPVEILHYDEIRAYVRGAVRDGERIVAEGLQRVVDGQAVRVGPPMDARPETVAAPAP